MHPLPSLTSLCVRTPPGLSPPSTSAACNVVSIRGMRAALQISLAFACKQLGETREKQCQCERKPSAACFVLSPTGKRTALQIIHWLLLARKCERQGRPMSVQRKAICCLQVHSAQQGNVQLFRSLKPLPASKIERTAEQSECKRKPSACAGLWGDDSAGPKQSECKQTPSHTNKQSTFTTWPATPPTITHQQQYSIRTMQTSTASQAPRPSCRQYHHSIVGAS